MGRIKANWNMWTWSVEEIINLYYYSWMQGRREGLFSKIGWTLEVFELRFQEQAQLSRIVKQIGRSKWSLISQTLNRRFPHKCRSGKQCRERYIHYIEPSEGQEDTREWGIDELSKLFQLFLQFGAKWSTISRDMEHWSENFLKNKFNGSMRKLLRKISNFCRHKYKNMGKDVKFKTLLNLMHYPEGEVSHSREAIETIKNLQQEILSLAISIQKGEDSEEFLSEVQKGIHAFTTNNRGYLMGIGKKKNAAKYSRRKSNLSEPDDSNDDGLHNIITLQRKAETFCEKRAKNNGSTATEEKGVLDSNDQHGKRPAKKPNMMAVVVARPQERADGV